MRKLNEQEHQLLRQLSSVGGSHCFQLSDPISAAGHKALRSLERRSYLTVEPTDDGIRVTLTRAAQGLDEDSHYG